MYGNNLDWLLLFKAIINGLIDSNRCTRNLRIIAFRIICYSFVITIRIYTLDEIFAQYRYLIMLDSIWWIYDISFKCCTDERCTWWFITAHKDFTSLLLVSKRIRLSYLHFHIWGQDNNIHKMYWSDENTFCILQLLFMDISCI